MNEVLSPRETIRAVDSYQYRETNYPRVGIYRNPGELRCFSQATVKSRRYYSARFAAESERERKTAEKGTIIDACFRAAENDNLTRAPIIAAAERNRRQCTHCRKQEEKKKEQNRSVTNYRRALYNRVLSADRSPVELSN